MTVFSISVLETNTLVTDEIIYDENFMLFYKETFITKDLHEVLTNSHIKNINTNRLPLQQQKHATYDAIIEGSKEYENDPNDDPMLEDDKVKYTDNVHCTTIARNTFAYSEILTFATNLIYHAKIHKKLIESEVQSFIYTSLIPKIQKNPHLYIAIGELGVLYENGEPATLQKKEEPNPDLMLRRLIFSLACLFLDHTQMIIGIDLRAKVSISAFLSDIGKITIIDKLSKAHTNTDVDFSNEKLQLLIPKFSSDFLQQHMFSNDIIETVKNIYSFMPKDPSSVPSLRNVKDRYQFISINNTYANLIYQGVTPPDALKLIINGHSLYDANIVKNFIKIVNIVPIGSYVKLENGSIGFVYRKNNEFPQNPIVQLITNSNGTIRHKISYIQTAEKNFNIVSFVPQSDVPNYRYLRLTQLGSFIR